MEKNEWMQILKPGDTEEIRCNDMVRSIDVTKDGLDMGDQTWSDIESSLDNAMNSLSTYETQDDYQGIHDMKLTSIFATCDDEYFSSIENSVNNNFDLNLWENYYD